MTTLRRMLRNKLPKSTRRSRTRARLFETLEPRMMLNSDWSNPSRALDVNNDLFVTPMDALLIINRLRLKQIVEGEAWESVTYHCRGSKVTRDCISFLATSELVSGVIRVVIVRFADQGWAAYFCTDPQVEALDILETIADRWAIEEHFHDVKEVWGAGKQQVRNLWLNIACWHLNQWMYTLVEFCSWDAPQAELTDRSARSWDNAHRRPSHADKRRTIAKQMLEKQYLTCLPKRLELEKIRQAIVDLIGLSA